MNADHEMPAVIRGLPPVAPCARLVARRRRWRTGFMIALFVGKSARAEEADPLRTIESLVDQADFDRAQSMAKETLSSGRLNKDRLARVHLFLGIISAAKGDGAAEPSFERALTLEPSLGLPPSAGPHVVAEFARAREVMAAAPPLELSVTFSSDANPSHVLVDVRLKGNRDRIVDRLIVRGEGFYDTRALGEPGLRIVETLPEAPPCISLEAAAVDAYGNEAWPNLARVTSCHPATSSAPPAPPTELLAKELPASTSSRPVPASVWIAGSITGALGVATGLLGILALERRNDFLAANDDPARTLDDRRNLRSSALASEHLATIGGIATVAAAMTTATLYFTRPTRVGSASVEFGASIANEGLAVRGKF